MDKTKVNLENKNHQFIIAALASLVEDEGMTVRDVAVLLRSIEREIFPALMQISRGEG